MKNRIKQINSESGEFIGYTLEIKEEQDSLIQVVSFPGISDINARLNQSK